MNWITTQVKRFFCEEDGVTAIEYGLIAALIAVIIIAGVRATGLEVLATFNAVAAAM